MIDQVANAFKRKDYKTAAHLLKQLVKQEPQNPWVKLYIGQLQEIRGKEEVAEAIYRRLLQETTHPKVMSQARLGVKRLVAREQERREEALRKALTDPNNTQLGVLVLEPINVEAKQVAAQKLASIMGIDAYTARLQLPTRGWRLYRIGPVGELQFYASELQKESIPCLWVTLADVEKINVFNVNSFSPTEREENEATALTATVFCHNLHNQLSSLTFNWSEVAQRVEGFVPLFEKVLDIDVRRKLQRKTQTLDYVQFCDLHLTGRGIILRLCDRHLRWRYSRDQHHQSQPKTAFSPVQQNKPSEEQKESLLNQGTTRRSWNNLLEFLNRQLPEIPVWSDFTIFAETAIDYQEMLGRLNSHIDLFRLEETPWDSAFQLYSSLVMLKSQSERSNLK
ncbi:MAG: tetratricopeptide repeat protein [Coleofasciculaceae cyanobacterium]